MEEIGIAGNWSRRSAHKATALSGDAEFIETTEDEDLADGGDADQGRRKEREDKAAEGLLHVEGDELRWFESKTSASWGRQRSGAPRESSLG